MRADADLLSIRETAETGARPTRLPILKPTPAIENFRTAGQASGGSADAIGYAKFYSRSRNAVICVYDEAGNQHISHICGNWKYKPKPQRSHKSVRREKACI
jgi:hypothetical protein